MASSFSSGCHFIYDPFTGVSFDLRVNSALLDTISLLDAIITSVSDPFPYDQVVKFTFAFRVWLLYF